MRIALISEHASPLAAIGGVDSGGQNVYVASVARCLAAAGHQVDVYTRRDHAGLPSIVQVDERFRVFNVPAGPAAFVPKEQLMSCMPAFAVEMRRMMSAQLPYDVLHANFFMSGWVALELRRLIGTPVVVTFHALGGVRREHQASADGFPPEREAIEQTLVDEADLLIPECPQDEADLIRLHGADPHRMRMVPCGVDIDLFAPSERADARRATGLPDDAFVVLQLGRMVPRKGVDTVVRAFAALPAGWGARLAIVGGDCDPPDEQRTPELRRLRLLAAELGAGDRVLFAGCKPRDALPRWYGAADVFVTTPWYEPFGITPLEAMACARPVIGSAVGGIRHSVVDGVTGFLVPPDDPVALGRRLAELRDDPSLAARMGQAGRQRVVNRFTWEAVASQLLAGYRTAVARPRARYHRRGQGTAARWL